MTNNFVTVRGIKYYVEYGTLDLHGIGITDITEINGLEHLKNLQILDLNGNLIKDINGLDNLINLQELHLNDNQIEVTNGLETLTHLRTLDLRNNEIKEIKGLEILTLLQTLYLGGNPIRNDERYLIRESAQAIVRYCEEKVEMINERLKDP